MAERVRAVEPVDTRAAPVVLDALDRDIIALLTEDARLSVRAIARELGRSPGAIGERLARLEASGVIVGYYADIDFSRLGYMRTLLGVRLESDDVLDTCVEAITALEEIQRVWVVTGSWAMVAEAHVRDAVHLRKLLQQRMRRIAGVQHTEAMIVLESAGGPQPSVRRAETVALLDHRPEVD